MSGFAHTFQREGAHSHNVPKDSLSVFEKPGMLYKISLLSVGVSEIMFQLCNAQNLHLSFC